MNAIMFTDPIILEENWVPITEKMVKGIKPYYMVSDYGRIYSFIIDSIMLQHLTSSGYSKATLRTNYGPTQLGVHRLVMLGFEYIDGCENLDVNRKDGIKTNNFYTNLEWMTKSENLLHAYANGLHHLGEDNILSNHTNEQVHMICKYLEDKIPLRKIAELVGLEPNDTNMKFVSCIKNKVTWRHISDKYNIPQERNNQLFTNEQIHEICKMIVEGLPNHEIISNLNLNLTKDQYYTVMYSIRSGKRFTNISKNYF